MPDRDYQKEIDDLRDKYYRDLEEIDHPSNDSGNQNSSGNQGNAGSQGNSGNQKTGA